MPYIKIAFQKAADVWKKDVYDLQAFSQTFLELRVSLGNEEKTPRLGLELPDLAWNSQTSFSRTSATTRVSPPPTPKSIDFPAESGLEKKVLSKEPDYP